MNFTQIVLIGGMFLSQVACKKDTVEPISTIHAGNDPNFKIVQNTDAQFLSFNKKVDVFGIDIYGAPGSDDNRLLHAANIMAQYLDNNEDGVIDNQLVLDKMIENKAFMVFWKKESDISNISPPGDRLGQDLGNDETIPEWHTNGHTGMFDAALEEVWHIITHSGYSKVYPNIFGENPGTSLADAMDIARGGHFTSIPNPYPTSAWYSYTDETCDYNCMSTEYFYWAMTSILGAQENRLSEISHEWKLNTNTLVKDTDMAIYNLLTDEQYKFPKVLPDGTYKH